MASPEHPLAGEGTAGGRTLRDLFLRLRERKLVQWTLAYLAGAWLVLQLFGEVGESFGWSPVAGRVLIALLLIGLFVTLVLAWYHGEQGRQRVSGPELLMLAALLVIAGGVAWLVGREGTRPAPVAAASPGPLMAPPPAASRTIAVLPFANLSESRENEYFSDGITEDILTNLSQAGGLRVISRTSAVIYRGSSKPLRQIALELGVSHVVVGSVRRAGDRVRITVQLIDARTDEHLWAQSYDREIADVFQVQSEIAQQIAGALQVRLTRDERQRIATAPTDSLTAYTYYLQGRQYVFRLTAADTRRAIALFERAVELDPNFALAYAWLARAQMDEPSFPKDSAEALSRRAIALDPTLSDGYAALAERYRRQRRYALALEQYRKAVALNPSDATATAEIGETYKFMGRLDESIPWLKRGISLDPLTVWPYLTLSGTYSLLGDLDEAARWCRRGLELAPDFSSFHICLAGIDHRRGDLAGAREHARAAIALDPAAESTLATLEVTQGNWPAAREHYERAGAEVLVSSPLLGYVYWRLGQREEAERVFRAAEEDARRRLAEGNEGFGPHMVLASIHATHGRRAQALHELEEAAAHGYWDFWWLNISPVYAELRGEPRFQAVVARMRAEVERQRLRVAREGL